MEKVILFAIKNEGLFVAHQLVREWPDCEIAAICSPSDIGRFSKVIKRHYTASNAQEVIQAAKKAYQEFGGGHVHGYICSNKMLEWIVTYGKVIFDFIEFDNPYDIYQNILDKKHMEEVCVKLGVRTPKCYELSSLKSYDNIDYPVIVKPVYKMQGTVQKIKLLNDPVSFKEYIDNVVRNGGISIDNLICQTFISGNNGWEYGYGAYCQEGHPNVDICFHQFRQYPQGLCCNIREVSNHDITDKIREIVYPILKMFRYNGFIEFDIKQDENNKCFFLLDVNPRPWHSSEILRAKLGQSSVYSPSIMSNLAEWISPLDEIWADSNKRNLTKKECQDITGNTPYVVTYPISYPDDMKPKLVYLARNWKKYLKYSFRIFTKKFIP